MGSITGGGFMTEEKTGKGSDKKVSLIITAYFELFIFQLLHYSLLGFEGQKLSYSSFHKAVDYSCQGR